jgi:isoleucyl-tRNA synthetase
MDRVRDVASAGLALRKAHSRRVRLPLSKLTVVSSAANDLVPFADIISEELNVAEVACVELTDSAIESFGIARKLIPNARALGPRVGGAIQGLIAQAKAGEWTLTDGVVMIGEESLLEGEYTLELTSASEDTAVSFLDDGGFVLLDTTVSPVQEAEGLARDAIRWIQQERKAAGLMVSDRIQLRVEADESAREALETHRELICSETLATAFDIQELVGDEDTLPVGSGSQLRVRVSRNE